MKRKIKIRGYVGQNGQVIAYIGENELLEDNSDLAMCAESFSENVPIREISIEAEIDVNAIFKNVVIPGKLVVKDPVP